VLSGSYHTLAPYLLENFSLPCGSISRAYRRHRCEEAGMLSYRQSTGRWERSPARRNLVGLSATAAGRARGCRCERRRHRGLGRIVGVARSYRRRWRTQSECRGRGKVGAMAVGVPGEGARPPRACRRLRLPRMRTSTTQPPARVEAVYRVQAAHTGLDLA
jgi:hypothetical protein